MVYPQESSRVTLISLNLHACDSIICDSNPCVFNNGLFLYFKNILLKIIFKNYKKYHFNIFLKTTVILFLNTLHTNLQD